MEQRIEIALKDDLKDVEAERLSLRIKHAFGLGAKCRFVDAYNFEDQIQEEQLELIAKEVFLDKISQIFSVSNPLFFNTWRIEVGLLPGVTDNTGNTATLAVNDYLAKCDAGRCGVNIESKVHYSRIYSISAEFDAPTLDRIAAMLHNPLIERYVIHAPEDVPKPYLPKVNIPNPPSVERISLNIPKPQLAQLAKVRLLALNPEEMDAIRHHFKLQRVIKDRKKVGLDEYVTDVELEAIAQTWSEHCKHKIFNAEITYEENGEKHAINSLFRTFIRGATEQAKKPYVVSVFKDNGGIIKFNPHYDIAVKVETHNAPSALDPYGGALTGVLGVQRDILGTGLGASPIANVDILCFGPQDIDPKDVPKGVLHPQVISEGVIKGVEHGGNKMGIPTVNGSVIYEQGYLSRPLVYCGTIGIMPSEINGRRTSEKSIKSGHLAVVVGGRVGKDGIHGATFSSMQIDASVPQSVVQIGDPLMQKKALDLVLEARDKLLFDAITDCGAGGISSSIGELATFSGGCEIYLEKCPLKYPGLNPWEILVSESQERMTLAVPPEKLSAIQALAKVHDVEVSVVGKFTDSGYFHVLFNNDTVAYLGMEFLHDGVPQMKLEASWKKLLFPEPNIPTYDSGQILLRLLASPNITSKENVIRRLDHEVKGQSIVKPIMSGPSDAAVIRPLYDSREGLVISHGICPRYVQDPYAMAALAFDEAVRNALATGAKFGYLAALDNFSWPDPIKSERTPDGEQKLGTLVRSCIALYDCATSYGIPLISGKDSMKNDYYADEKKYSIPPTLLITVIGKIDDIRKSLCSEFRVPGSNIYILGKTKDELGGSEFYKLFGAIGNTPPQVHFDENVKLYRALSAAIEEGLVLSAHDMSDGGMALAFAECSLGTGLGAEIDLDLVPNETDNEESLLFAESAGRFIIAVSPEKSEKFEKIMKEASASFAKCGRVRGDKRFIIRRGEHLIVNEGVEKLREAFDKGVQVG